MRFKKTHGVQIVVVVGSGEFPHDMLRYDSCCPNEEGDSYALGNLQARAVVLRRFSQEADRGPTLARWGAGWQVAWWGDPDDFSANREKIMAPVEKAVAGRLARYEAAGRVVTPAAKGGDDRGQGEEAVRDEREPGLPNYRQASAEEACAFYDDVERRTGVLVRVRGPVYVPVKKEVDHG